MRVAAPPTEPVCWIANDDAGVGSTMAERLTLGFISEFDTGDAGASVDAVAVKLSFESSTDILQGFLKQLLATGLLTGVTSPLS